MNFRDRNFFLRRLTSSLLLDEFRAADFVSGAVDVESCRVDVA